MNTKNVFKGILSCLFLIGCDLDYADFIEDSKGSARGIRNSSSISQDEPIQPYLEFEPVVQGSAQCGPASFYMILNHYKIDRYFTQSDCSEIIDLRDTPEIITADTKIAQYINQGSLMGTSWEQLKDAADGLYYDCEPYFVTELNSRFTQWNDPKEDAERERRFEYIFKNYLLKNRPVMIHLKRYFLFSGHYIVLTGYDPQQEMVHYVDPNGGQAGTVSYNDFIKEKWYVSPGNPASWYRARWGGQWMSFYRLEDGEQPSFYTPHDLVLRRAGASRAVILNADDFGQNENINIAVKEGFEADFFTSTSMQVTHPAAADAMNLVSNLGNPSGVHLTLTSNQNNPVRPLSKPEDVPSLIGPEGLFHKDLFQFFLHAKDKEIAAELEAQYLAAQEAGIDVTHLDNHEGFAALGQEKGERPYLDLARLYDLPIRWTASPYDEKLTSRGLLSPTRVFVPSMIPNASDTEKAYADYKKRFLESLCAVEYGEIVEFVLHPMDGGPAPGYLFKHFDYLLIHDAEVMNVIEEENIALIGYSDLRAVQRELREF
jgi:predicted glycoside hydrolase/deacetylase ChbG (UPF0249 family)